MKYHANNNFQKYDAETDTLADLSGCLTVLMDMQAPVINITKIPPCASVTESVRLNSCLLDDDLTMISGKNGAMAFISSITLTSNHRTNGYNINIHGETEGTRLCA